MPPFDLFVLPFTIGMLFLVVTLVTYYVSWIKALPAGDMAKIKGGIFSFRTLQAAGEVFMESLLHRKIFRTNIRLGYMHASLAFGWFLLIMGGNIESRLFYNGHLSPPYVPIFFRFFNPHPENFRYEAIFSFTMDLFLLIVLSGVVLAWVKRFHSRFFGMKKTTRLKLGDKMALMSLWLIFPMRFLAESFTSGSVGGGHFLTSTAGSFFGSFLPVDVLVYPAWWAYSLVLGTFFVALPFSRYMHIPTEVLLIFLRKYGVTEKNILTSYSRVEINSCSRCGICIDPCPLTPDAKGIQSAYFLQDMRNNDVCDQRSLNCMMCGRCDSACPVGIDISSIRLAGRRQHAEQKKDVFTYVSAGKTKKADTIYFAGCMTHLQPSVKKSMVELMKEAGEKFWFMDELGSICCGRPLMLAGKETQAHELMGKNREMIVGSGAKTLVTSCPICYKMFKEQYKLDIEVLHHSEYLLRLIDKKKIKVNWEDISTVYHDPCELGRGSGIYEQPREVLSMAVHLSSVASEKDKAMCCGGSLGGLTVTGEDRRAVTRRTIDSLMSECPDLIATGCPLCKKTFTREAPVPVLDIAEIINKSLVRKDSAYNNLIHYKKENKIAVEE